MTKIQIIFYFLCIVVPILFGFTAMGYTIFDLFSFFTGAETN